MAVSYEFDTRVRSGVASAAGARTYVVALLKLIRSDPQIECPHESMIRPGRHPGPAERRSAVRSELFNSTTRAHSDDLCLDLRRRSKECFDYKILNVCSIVMYAPKLCTCNFSSCSLTLSRQHAVTMPHPDEHLKCASAVAPRYSHCPAWSVLQQSNALAILWLRSCRPRPRNARSHTSYRSAPKS